jgi:DNA-binding MarR family transcriptional regulator
LLELSSDQIAKLIAVAAALQHVQTELSLGQVVALIAIVAEPGLSVNELAERLQTPQQTASRHVAALLGRYQTEPAENRSRASALIKQEINPEDPRRRALFVSEDGRKLLETMLARLDGKTRTAR